MQESAKCKICRRNGRKLFLKGEKCFTAKCPMIKKDYPPGIISKKRRKSTSEYGKELKEKQKLRNWYGLSEKQFKSYVEEVLERMHKGSLKDENPAETLIKILESRLDNTIFRMGFTLNRRQARQLVVHGHFLLNQKPVHSPSISLREGDKISLRPTSFKNKFFTKVPSYLKQYQVPEWIKLDKVKMEGEIIGTTNLEQTAPPAEISSIFEFYSR